MPVAVRCPNPSCAIPLHLPDLAAAVRCPRCGRAFRVGAPAEAVTRDLPPADAATSALVGAAPSEAVTRTVAPEGSATAPVVPPSATAPLPERVGRFVVRRFLG